MEEKPEKNRNLPAHSRVAAAVSKLVLLAVRRTSGPSYHNAQNISRSSRIFDVLEVGNLYADQRTIAYLWYVFGSVIRMGLRGQRERLGHLWLESLPVVIAHALPLVMFRASHRCLVSSTFRSRRCCGEDCLAVNVPVA